jgi:hypothetical protein
VAFAITTGVRAGESIAPELLEHLGGAVRSCEEEARRADEPWRDPTACSR